ncbi:DEAD/DEAH box helicase [Rufibacter glacialis]|uniref:DEAD-box ATP-dependent RNA helicase RhpA n=1 Tax=Rufibacter glacialis TaxID=1259555 RepID=A0A5M8QBN8_9BACT|nr:DEAD/DEAH box helicase [Rufibacter glacialis]KAA6433379.1 DEAD/DEAH box helicase [Rufibacter glacialis]GGK74701.1 DEAD/DEAH box family ATP-dependent RNA helicase [Rufibacter glacialis]
MTFSELQLIEPLLQALHEEGYTTPTPIQEQAIPPVLNGDDLLGCAQTGTGKTAAFSLPLLHRLHEAGPAHPAKAIRALILTPTRELALQIGDSIKAYGRHTKIKYTVVFGGVGQVPQVEQIKRGVDIVVATPGRLLDLMNQGLLSLKHIETFILDEADRMLDMGFIHDVRKVIAQIPTNRQTLLFSATMPQEIQKLSASILRDPVYVEVTPVSSTVEKITQKVFFVDKTTKRALLKHLLQGEEIQRALIFSRTKHGADRIAKELSKAGISAQSIHGDKAQSSRVKALTQFKNNELKALVATDIAARGIDVDDLTHVINVDLPNEPETYVHRIGRTGRAGAEGMALSFCDDTELPYLRDIEKLTKQNIPVEEDQPFHADYTKLPLSGGKATDKIARKNSGGGNPGQNRGPRSGGQGGRRPDQRQGASQSGGRRPDQRQGSGQGSGSKPSGNRGPR